MGRRCTKSVLPYDEPPYTDGENEEFCSRYNSGRSRRAQGVLEIVLERAEPAWAGSYQGCCHNPTNRDRHHSLNVSRLTVPEIRQIVICITPKE
jgi:hypothetical protein